MQEQVALLAPVQEQPDLEIPEPAVDKQAPEGQPQSAEKIDTQSLRDLSDKLAEMSSALRSVSEQLPECIVDKLPRPRKAGDVLLVFDIGMMSINEEIMRIKGEVPLSGFLLPQSAHNALKTAEAVMSTLVLVPFNARITQILEDIRKAQMRKSTAALMDSGNGLSIPVPPTPYDDEDEHDDPTLRP